MEALEGRDDIKRLIESIAQENDMKNYIITNVLTNKKGEGFLSQFFLVAIKDAVSHEQLDIALKTAYVEDTIREMVPVRKSFENEIYFYSKVLPLFEKFEAYRGITPQVQLFPKCFKVSIEEQSEMLALEDLKAAGFQMFEKSFLNHEHASLIFKMYGRFHGYSFALRDQWPQEYERVAGGLYNLYREFMEEENSFMRGHFRKILECIELYFVPGEDDDIIEKFQQYGIEGLLDCVVELAENHDNCTAILHGDCWTNNVMFKYEKTDKSEKLIDIRLIDWQIAKVGNPVCDLSYLFYSGASDDMLDRLNEYLEIYYESFCTFVRQLGSNPEKLFSFEALNQQWKKFSKLGLILGLTVLRTKMIQDNEIIDLTDGYEQEEFYTVLNDANFDEECFKKATKKYFCHAIARDAL